MLMLTVTCGEPVTMTQSPLFGIPPSDIKVCLAWAGCIKWGDKKAIPVCGTIILTEVEVYSLCKVLWPMFQHAR